MKFTGRVEKILIGSISGMNLLKEQLKGTAEINQKTEFNSQLFIVSTIDTETMSSVVRKFSEFLLQFMNFLRERFRWLQHSKETEILN